jgi:hypothetical protein
MEPHVHAARPVPGLPVVGFAEVVRRLTAAGYVNRSDSPPSGPSSTRTS